MKRKLRPSIEKVLMIIELLLIVFVSMINDFEMNFLPVMLALMAIIAVNGYVLIRWGHPND